MTRDEARAYARQWADDWNRLDLEAIFAHFADDVVWSSPKALQAIGVATLHGKVAPREYLRTVLAIIYDCDIGGQRDRASEILHFGSSGRVDRGEVVPRS